MLFLPLLALLSLHHPQRDYRVIFEISPVPCPCFQISWQVLLTVTAVETLSLSFSFPPSLLWFGPDHLLVTAGTADWAGQGSQDHPKVQWFTGRIHSTQHILICMAKVYCSERIIKHKAKTAEGPSRHMEQSSDKTKGKLPKSPPNSLTLNGFHPSSNHV